MKFVLNSKIIESENKDKIKYAIILLHGYGGDGADISSIAHTWRRFIDNTIFFCPDGPQTCKLNPIGFQWFDLSIDDQNYIIAEVRKTEKILIEYVDQIKEKFKLINSQIILAGFSQGCMMSINVGLSSDETYSGILGFSGKIINKKELSNRITNKPKILLIHGENDDIVPCIKSLEAKDFLERNKVSVKLEIIKDCGHHIPIEASSIGLKFIKKIFNLN